MPSGGGSRCWSKAKGRMRAAGVRALLKGFQKKDDANAPD
jgi:hypothetical protein